MQWISSAGSCGLPAEFLYSVLRARRSRLSRDLKSFERLARQNPSPWAAPLEEASWVHARMGGELARAFEPFFAFLGLRLLFIWLRFRPGGATDAQRALVQSRFLCPRLRRRLDAAKSPLETARLIAGLPAEGLTVEHLAEKLAADGERAFETAVMDQFYLRLHPNRLDAPVGRFFAELIDQRNLLGLYKKLRWQIPGPADLLPGGRLMEKRLGEIGTLEELNAKVLRIGGTGADEQQIETVLLRALTRRVRLEGRDPLSPALILDYLWACWMQGRNLALARAAAEAGAELPTEELIL